MDDLSIWLLAMALAVDCFAVSITSGIILGRRRIAKSGLMAFLFGLFQALMPLAGWILMARLSGLIERFDHWIAFLLLLFLGGKMIFEGLGKDDRNQEQGGFDPTRLTVMLTLAVATSIDALAVGFTFSLTGYTTVASLLYPVSAIGAVSMAMSILGTELGLRFGRAIRRRIRPELLGGLILTAIGFRILLEHLLS